MINGARADDLVLGSGLVTRQRWVMPLWQSVLVVTGKAVFRSIVWAARCWSITFPAVLLGFGWVRYGPTTVGLTVATVVGFAVAWWLAHPASFVVLVGPAWSSLLGNWRLTTKYRRWETGRAGIL